MKLFFYIAVIIMIMSFAVTIKAAQEIRLDFPFPCPPNIPNLGECKQNITNPETAIQDYIIKLYQFGVGIAGILAVGMIAAGAVYKIINAGNSSKQQEGTEMMKSAIWGIVLLLGSYLILRTVNPRLVNLDLGDIPVVTPAEPYAYTPFPGEGVAPDIDASPEAQAYCMDRTRNSDRQEDTSGTSENFKNCLRGWNKCDSCVPLDPSVKTKPNQCRWGSFYESDCLVRPQTNTGLMALKNALGDIFQVTEAWPPTAKHNSDGHYNGCAVDIKITDGGEDLCQTVQRTIAAAEAAGFRPYNEYPKCEGTSSEKSSGKHIHLTAKNCP